MRKVKIEGMKHVFDFDSGLFHQWIVLKNSTGETGCYAVIEFEDGSVKSVYCERIIFVKE